MQGSALPPAAQAWGAWAEPSGVKLLKRMIELLQTVVSAALPVHERLTIRKNRLAPPTGDTVGLPRLCVITGTHGDELEGQYVCYELQRRIHAQPEALTGIVDIYPATNPLGMDTIRRGIPMFDLDMNRIFPGSEDGPAAEYLAARLMADLQGAACAVDIHASNIFLREIPQVRLGENNAGRLLPLARLLNTDFIWVHASATVLESTLAYSLNAAGVPALAVEMGISLRLTPAYGDQLTDGLFALMAQLGIWSGKTPPVRTPTESTDGEVALISAERPGMFIPAVPHGAEVQRGQLIGEIVDPLRGEAVQRVTAPGNGWLFTLREYPACYAGSVLARILLGGAVF